MILPDSVHGRASDLFVGSIHDYVATGGHLMLVYDAAVETLQGFYSRDRSRLSDLAGVDYALYKTLGSSTIQASDVSGTIPVMDELGVPPGKYFPFIQPPPGKSGASAPIETQLRRYQYGSLAYPSFVTSGEYSGHVLLHSPAGVVAGEHNYQKGSVLFVNLPLGYLKSNTDGLPLHAFLQILWDAHVVAALLAGRAGRSRRPGARLACGFERGHPVAAASWRPGPS